MIDRSAQVRLQVGVMVLAGALGAGHASGQGVLTLWNNQCASCHGENGSGGNATSLLDDEWITGSSFMDQFHATRDGIEDLGMPPYGETLTDPQIWALVVYMQELRSRHARHIDPWRADVDAGVDTQHHRYRVDRVIENGLETPWAVAFIDKDRVLVSERPGRLRVLEDGDLVTVEGTPEVWEWGQGGLLDVAAHPEFDKNRWIYLSYSHRWEERGRAVGMTHVVRGRLEPEGSGYRWTDEEVIYDPPRGLGAPSGLHFGCRLVFRDGYLYFCIGDRGRGDDAPDLSRPNGKVHRVHDDGRVPSDNPFVDRDDALPTVWSAGHRNPQGMVFDSEGRLWVTEHGPRGGDELNLVQRGADYGWPVVSHGIHYNGRPLVTPWPEEGSDIAMPSALWLPSIAVCGLAAGTGGAFPEWEGDLLAGGLAGQIVERIRVDASGQVVEREAILRDEGRVRDVKVAPDGSVWVVLNRPDTVWRLIPAE